MPSTLIDAGLLDGVLLAKRVDLPEPVYTFEPDAKTGIRNLPALVDFTLLVERAVSASLQAGHVPIVLGGDCSVLLGPALALRKLGRHALVHLDGHNDFGHEGKSGKPYATIAGADLAVVTGRGPEALTNITGLKPYFRDEDVIQLGEKANADAADHWLKDYIQTKIRRHPFVDIRRLGIEPMMRMVTAELDRGLTAGFWLHLDLDVLDPELMPAVDSPDPTGLTWQELDIALSHLVSHRRLLGLNVGIYDPDLDPDGRHATKIAALLRRHLLILAGRGSYPPSS
jgi:arginase